MLGCERDKVFRVAGSSLLKMDRSHLGISKIQKFCCAIRRMPWRYFFFGNKTKASRVLEESFREDFHCILFMRRERGKVLLYQEERKISTTHA